MTNYCETLKSLTEKAIELACDGQENFDELYKVVQSIIDSCDDICESDKDSNHYSCNTTWEDVIRHTACLNILAEAIAEADHPVAMMVVDSLRNDAIGIRNFMENI